MSRRFTLGALPLLCCLLGAALPKPLPNHPGNVFLAGERVIIPAPSAGAQWTLTSYDGAVTRVATKNKMIDAGTLPVGYYELRLSVGGPRATTIAVIAPLAAATPETSPISLDVAMAWFYKAEPQQRAVANLCTLAGVSWVRDRLNWGEVETARGQFANHTIYDDTATIQSEAGLRVLQVNHMTPAWAAGAGGDAKHFPPDLRDLHRFYRETAKRWKGKVLAFEPWNEADIPMFGGHAGCEISSLQKAAYFGLKAGNPDVIASQNVFANPNAEILADFFANRPWPYFDTYNLHHYVGLDRYPAVYAAHRNISAQRPMWVTECNMPVEWQGDAKMAEPSDADLRVQAERVAQVYAASLFEGSANTFYFMLPHYVENKTQYGVLHEDLTPRPAFCALAAVGRLLADARGVGGWQSDDPNAKGYVFAAKPDGQERRVLVIWRSAGAKELQFNQPFERVFDHLGREKKNVRPGHLSVSPAPIFVILPSDGVAPRAAPQPPQTERPSPLVFQPGFPRDSLVLAQSAYVLNPKQPGQLKLIAYNLSDAAITSPLGIDAPKGWTCNINPSPIELAPGERKELILTIAPHDPAAGVHPITVVATAGEDHPLISFRLIDEMPQSAVKK